MENEASFPDQFNKLSTAYMRISLLNAVVQTILPRTSNTLSYPGVQRQLYPFIHSTTTTKAYSKMAENRERVNKAAWIVEEKGKFEVRDAPIIEPEKGQVLVRVYFAIISHVRITVS